MHYSTPLISSVLIAEISKKLRELISAVLLLCLLVASVYAAPVPSIIKRLQPEAPGSGDSMVSSTIGSSTIGSSTIGSSTIGSGTIGSGISSGSAGLVANPSCSNILESAGSIEHMIYRDGFHAIILDNSVQDEAFYQWVKFDDAGHCVNVLSGEAAYYDWIQPPQELKDFKSASGDQVDFYIGYNAPEDSTAAMGTLTGYCIKDGLPHHCSSFSVPSRIVSYLETRNQQYLLTDDQLYLKFKQKQEPQEPFYPLLSEFSLLLDTNEKIVTAASSDSQLFILTTHPESGWKIKSVGMNYDKQYHSRYPDIAVPSDTFPAVYLKDISTIQIPLLTVINNQLHFIFSTTNSSLTWHTYSMKGNLESVRTLLLTEQLVTLKNLLLVELADTVPVQLQVIGMGSQNGKPWKDKLSFKDKRKKTETDDDHQSSAMYSYGFIVLFVLVTIFCLYSYSSQ